MLIFLTLIWNFVNHFRMCTHPLVYSIWLKNYVKINFKTLLWKNLVQGKNVSWVIQADTDNTRVNYQHKGY